MQSRTTSYLQLYGCNLVCRNFCGSIRLNDLIEWIGLITTSFLSSAISFVGIVVGSFLGLNYLAGTSQGAANASVEQSQPGGNLFVATYIYWFAHVFHFVADNLCKHLQATDPFERRLWLGVISLGIILLIIGHLDQIWKPFCGQFLMFCTSSCATCVYFRQSRKESTLTVTTSKEMWPLLKDQSLMKPCR